MFLSNTQNVDNIVNKALEMLPGGVIWTYGVTDASFINDSYMTLTHKTYITYKWINGGVWNPPESPIIDIFSQEFDKNDPLLSKKMEECVNNQLKLIARMTLDLINILPSRRDSIRNAWSNYIEHNRTVSPSKKGYYFCDPYACVKFTKEFQDVLKSMEYINREEMEKRVQVQQTKSGSIKQLPPETDNPFYGSN